jgi:ribosomal protein S18 acetylase RimI-like enzyme
VLERRPAADADEPFLRELFATTRPELTWWDDGARETFVDVQVRGQRQEWEARFPDSLHELILFDGNAVGRVWVAWPPGECEVLDMTLLPEHRRGGIGTQIMREILAEADRREVPVRLTVEHTNAASLAFCERLAFAPVADDDVYVVLERPVSAS